MDTKNIPQHLDPRNLEIRSELYNGELMYSLVDLMAVFSDTTNSRRMWSDTKKRLRHDGFQLYDGIVQLKMQASDGKKYITDCANLETCIRIVQSIPSPKAEPVRQWLASLGAASLRAIRYSKQGKDQEWATLRLKGIDARKLMTEAMQLAIAGIEGKHYAQTTTTTYIGLFGRTVAAIRHELNLNEKQDLRDELGEDALFYLRKTEQLIAELLTETEILTWGQFYELILLPVIQQFKGLIDHHQRIVKKDIVTGKRLLKP